MAAKNSKCKSKEFIVSAYTYKGYKWKYCTLLWRGFIYEKISEWKLQFISNLAGVMIKYSQYLYIIHLQYFLFSQQYERPYTDMPDILGSRHIGFCNILVWRHLTFHPHDVTSLYFASASLY
jgi:hypothetical protein